MWGKGQGEGEIDGLVGMRWGFLMLVCGLR